MTNPETITLPRSGLVLRHDRETIADYHECDVWRDDSQLVALYHGISADGLWEGCTPNDGLPPTSFEECVRVMDEAIVNLRVALMPTDARDRIAKECWHFDRVSDWSEADDAEREAYHAQADAILAALGVGEDE